MKKNLAAPLILAVIALAGYAQEESASYRVGAALGYSFTGYREETYTPVNRYLNSLTFLLDGNIEKGAFFHSLNLGFYTGNSTMSTTEEAVLSQDYDPLTGEAYYLARRQQYRAIRGYLEYALDYRLWGAPAFPGFLGGAFRADTYLQFANYPSITGLVSLDLHATQKWLINAENTLTLSAGFPVFGYAVRPPYAGADAALIKYASEQPMKILTLGKVTSLHNYWAFFGDLKYRHRVNALVSLYSGLGIELSRINFPRPRLDAILRLSSGIAFSF
ncbi:MAG: hypothetical protein FWH41_03420 [Treponema sp.]|nr:hypothetical protein [Treponema sp.]